MGTRLLTSVQPAVRIGLLKRAEALISQDPQHALEPRHYVSKQYLRSIALAVSRQVEVP